MLSTLKQLLHDGVVKFTYKKANGEIRNAKGTTAAELVPVEEETDTYLLTDIQWNAEELVNYPAKLRVKVPVTVAENDINDYINDRLLEEYGVYHNGFLYEKLAPRKKPENPSSVRYFDLNKNEWRSFNKDRLISIDN